MMKWIDIKDKLPEDKQYVIIHKKSFWRERALQGNLMDIRRFLKTRNAFYPGSLSPSDVTHWMPLPKSPETYDTFGNG